MAAATLAMQDAVKKAGSTVGSTQRFTKGVLWYSGPTGVQVGGGRGGRGGRREERKEGRKGGEGREEGGGRKLAVSLLEPSRPFPPPHGSGPAAGGGG